ncbi:MAG: hypothetical protein DMG50_22430 [Acidobacteria bacterium]|nr:MAG: hypothetical protein DMG50_22430 [Acidobacteriota bacterium]
MRSVGEPWRIIMQKKILGVLVLLLVSSGFSFGQRLTGGISLRVTDPQGNAVPNVKASVLSKEHGTKVEVAGTNEGEVTVADLAPGEYEVVIQHEGFRKTTVTLTVRIGVNTSLDIHLEVGAVSESIIVEANTVTVDTSKSTVQGVIEAAQIDQLPLNGRNFLDLAQMAPGVQVVDGGSFDPTKNQFAGVSVGGRSGRSTRIQVDGVDITDETVGTTVMNLTNESIEEFGIAQSSLDVSTDLTSTGAINIISRSGSNDIHGSGFGFWRRSDFAANNGPLDVLNPVKPVFSRDNYGGRLGGPFLKSKLFWFLSYERQKQAGAITAKAGLQPDKQPAPVLQVHSRRQFWCHRFWRSWFLGVREQERHKCTRGGLGLYQRRLDERDSLQLPKVRERNRGWERSGWDATVAPSGCGGEHYRAGWILIRSKRPCTAGDLSAKQADQV